MPLQIDRSEPHSGRIFLTNTNGFKLEVNGDEAQLGWQLRSLRMTSGGRLVRVGPTWVPNKNLSLSVPEQFLSQLSWPQMLW